MAEDRMNVTAQCLKHTPPVPVVVDDENDDASIVRCPECGQTYGTWGEVKKAMHEAAVKEVQGMLDDTVKGMKGWKFTKS